MRAAARDPCGAAGEQGDEGGRLNQLGVAQPQLAVLVLAPRVAAAVLGERHRVRAAARHLHDARRGEGAHRPRLERTFAVRVAATQLAVAVATEAPRDAALRERERVSAAARHLQQEEVCVAHRMAHRVPRAAGGCAW